MPPTYRTNEREEESVKVKELRVSYAETRSFPGEFGNVRPSVEYLVEVQEGEDPDVVRRELMEKASGTVRGMLVRALQQRLPDLFEKAEARGDCPLCGKADPEVPPCPRCGQV